MRSRIVHNCENSREERALEELTVLNVLSDEKENEN